MDLSVYILGTAVLSFFLAIIAQGFKEPKTRMHVLANSSESPEIAERHYNRVRTFQRFCMLLGLALILAAVAAFIIPRWDNLERNLNKSKQNSSTLQSTKGQHQLAFLFDSTFVQSTISVGGIRDAL